MQLFSTLKGACKKGGNKIFSKAFYNKTRGDGFKLKQGQFKLVEKEENFYSDGAKTLEQVVRRGGRCPLLGNTEGQVEWVSGQSDVSEDVPVCGAG